MLTKISQTTKSLTDWIRASPAPFRLFAGVLTLAIVLVWFAYDSEAEPWSIIPGPQESTRVTTLRKVSDAANEGYYFQMGKLIPVEHEWEDPGQYFLYVNWGIIKRFTGLGKLEPLKDAYRVELGVVLFIICLLCFTRLFNLPKWFWIFLPVFFLWALVPKYALGWEHIQKINGLLYMSISTRWVKMFSGLWVFVMTLQFFQWWREGVLFEVNKKRLIRLFVMGVVLGLLMSIRKDIIITGGLALLSALILLTIAQKNLDRTRMGIRRALVPGIILATVLGGCLAYQLLIVGAWKIRDHCYPMQNVSRIYGRPVWHSLTAGLGVVPNTYGITWGDIDVWNIIRNRPENAGISYGTVEHEKAARKLYFEIITRDPDLFWRSTLYKFNEMWRDHHNGINRCFLIVAVMFFLGTYYRWLGLIFLFDVLSNMVILIMVNQWLHYGLDLITHYRFVQLIGTTLIVYRILELGYLFLKNKRNFFSLQN